MKPSPALAFALLLLAGCSRDETAYPSLAHRPIEKLGFAEPEITVAVAAPDPALDAKISTATTTLDTVTKGFAGDAARATAAGKAARGEPAGSDAWLDAQSALADLDGWRAQASSLVTDLDQLAADRAQALAPDYPALTALHDRAQAEADREAETIRQLQDALPAA